MEEKKLKKLLQGKLFEEKEKIINENLLFSEGLILGFGLGAILVLFTGIIITLLFTLN